MKNARAVFSVVLLTLALSNSLSAAEPRIERVKVGERYELDGILLEVNKAEKYLLVKGPLGDSRIRFDDETTLYQEIAHVDKIDHETGIMEMNVLGAGQPGRAKLPSPAYITADFGTAEEFEKLWGNTGERRLGSHTISALGVEPQEPTSDDPKLAGRLEREGLVIGDETFDVALGNGGQLRLSLDDLVPYSHMIVGSGKKISEDEVKADRIVVNDVTDPIGIHDPKLPRYLYIGDSISLHYGKALGEALEGKVNLHRPPTNCRRSLKGVLEIHKWLRAYDRPGRHWDVISFNFGHWDSWNSKERYQSQLEYIIQQLKKTEAKLIWVTSSPVPFGYNIPGIEFKNVKRENIPITEARILFGSVPGRMRVENEWAAEVMARHPEVAVCDHWQLVMNEFDGFYRDWLRGRRIHLYGDEAAPLGRALARCVMKVLGRPESDIKPLPEASTIRELSDRRPEGWKSPAKELGRVPVQPL